MRAVVQRVTEASVTVHGNVIGAIRSGLLVLVGIEGTDTEEDVEWLVYKLLKIRIFCDSNRVINLSVQDVQGEVLLVSQFTLFASTKKGNRPSYIRAARPEVAIPLYETLIRCLARDLGKPVQTGQFGADMKVTSVNDGPVTICIDTKAKE